MAVYRWIYANAKMEGNRKDYHVRVCDPALESYKQTLTLLSNRLLSTDKRYGKGERQTCWFAGYIDQKMYLTAIGGDQKELLGVSPEGYRSQHCVLAYGFTGADIRLYKRNDKMFGPLKDIMREIQRTGRDISADGTPMQGRDFLAYAESPEDSIDTEEPNIRKSTTETDERLWKQSLSRPVMTGIISVADAKKLLKLFPSGTVTVMEDAELTYNKDRTIGTKNLLRDLEESEAQRKAEKEKAEKELAELKRRAEISQPKPEHPADARGQGNKIWMLLVIIISAFIGSFGALILLLSR